MLTHKGLIDIRTYGQQTGTSKGVAISGPGTANTYSAWTQIAASTDIDAVGFWLNGTTDFQTSGSANSRMLVDVAIGASSSELAVVSSIMAHHTADGLSWSVWVPVKIPAGSRVSVRMELDTTATTQDYFTVTLVGYSMDGFPGFGACDTMGDNTGSSRGTTVTAGSANTKGSWSQIVASTAHDYRELLVAADHFSNQGRGLLDIGVGGSGSEVVLIPDLHVNFGQQNQAGKGQYWNLPVSIPAGTRLAARTQCDQASATADVILYGLS